MARCTRFGALVLWGAVTALAWSFALAAVRQTPAWAQAPATPWLDEARVRAIAALPLAQQRQRANQEILQRWAVFNVRAYQNQLVGTVLGDATVNGRRIVDFGNADQYRKQVLAAPMGNGRSLILWDPAYLTPKYEVTDNNIHLPGGSFRMNGQAASTLWHEFNHAQFDLVLGNVGRSPQLNPMPPFSVWKSYLADSTDNDDDHFFIECIGERTMDWLQRLLVSLSFEKNSAAAAAAEQVAIDAGQKVNWHREHELWLTPTDVWARAWPDTKKIIPLSPSYRQLYDQYSHVSLPLPADVQQFYITGQLTSGGKSVKVHDWVVADSPVLCAVSLTRSNLTGPKVGKDVIESGFDITLTENYKANLSATRGMLTVSVETDDLEARAYASIDRTSLPFTSVRRGQQIEIDISTYRQALLDGAPFVVRVVRPLTGLDRRMKAKLYKVTARYIDVPPAKAPSIYQPSAMDVQLSITAADLPPVSAPTPTPKRAPSATPGGKPATPPLDGKLPADATKPGEKAPTPIPLPSPTPGQDRTADHSVVTFGGTVPGIWAGSNDPKGFDFRRQNAKTTGTGDCKWEAEVRSEISGRIDAPGSASTPEEITRRGNEVVASSKAWGATAVVRPFAIGDFKGQFVDTSVAFRPGGWSDGGFRGDGVNAGGRGWLINGRHTVEIAYNVSGSGCWTNVDRAFLESQASAAQADAKSIVASLTLVEKGSFATVPYTGPKLDGSDMPTVTLSPPALEKLKVGDTVNVSVVVENAKPADRPFRYNWAGEFEGKADTAPGEATITIKPKKPGTYPLSVSVDGARYNLGSASLAYEVADLKAEITQRLPTTKVTAVGSPVTFSARLLSSGIPITGSYVYRWQPTPDVAFEPGEGPTNQTRAVFSRPGVTRVWVQVLEKKGTVLTTLAESNPLDIEVAQPEITLRMFPPEPYPGQQVRITASETPVVGDAFITYWWEYSGRVLNPGAEANPRVYSFRPKDTTAVTVTAHAKARDGGDELGTKALVVMARPHNVQVTGPTAQGPRPQLWSAQAGRLVDVDQQIAVFQDVSMRANVTPAPVNQPLRYQWTVSPDGCSISNPISREPTFNCSQTGSFAPLVTVRDNLGATLGTGAGTLSVSISQAALQKSKAQAAAAEQAERQELAAQQAKIDADRKAATEAAQQQRDELARGATAQRLRVEGQALQQQGKLREAIAKYRESLKSVADPALESYIAQVEALAARQESVPTPSRGVTSPTGTSLVIFKNTNTGGVLNSPPAPTQFTISTPHLITYVFTYHWNNRSGSTQTGTIALRHSNGTVYGPWATTGTPGQGGVINANWEVRPNVVVPAGSYTIVDSAPSTWAHNGESGGRGHAIVEGHAVAASGLSTPVVTTRPNPSVAATPASPDASKRSQARRLYAEGDACEQKGDLNCAITKYEAAVAILPNQQVSDKIAQLRAVLAQDVAGKVREEKVQAPAIDLILGLWRSTHHAHQGCRDVQSICIASKLDLQFSRRAGGALEGRIVGWGEFVMVGELQGHTWSFSGTLNGSPYAWGSFVFSEDCRSFKGVIDVIGHHAVWTGSR